MRTALVLLSLLLFTPPLAALVVLAAMLGFKDGPGSVFDVVPRLWFRILVAAGGVRVRTHGLDKVPGGRAHVFVSNHTSWYDVFVIGALLRHYKFVAKAELERIPIFGAGVRAAGFIFVDRNNRKAAFAEYETAARRIRQGASVVVFPEGTRGDSYRLRPFKKGPFVLAIAAEAPIVPVVVYGTREVQHRSSLRVRAGEVHVHFLEPVSTQGLTYDARQSLSRETWRRMSEVLQAHHGVQSAPDPVTDPSPVAVPTD